MRAVAYETYGLPDVLELREVDQPDLAEDGLLVRVHAASVNPEDWHMLTGTPYLARLWVGLLRPKRKVLGIDFAGTVEAAGPNVKQFQPGDEVFGGGTGAFAEYVAVGEDRAVIRKPTNLTFEQAAAVPVAAITALQALRDKGRVRAGHRVLINGASGGVGTFAVQIAKAFGADVTGVCSTPNVERVRSLGADHVIDYTHEDFTRGDRRYDVLIDVAGNRSWADCRRVLTASAILVVLGGPKSNRWIGPLGHMVGRRLASLRRGPSAVSFLARITKADLEVLRELLEERKVTPIIDRRYDLSAVPDALRYVGEGHARGKVVVVV